MSFQHAAARRRLDRPPVRHQRLTVVSTRSRPKAAGRTPVSFSAFFKFQHAAARRRLVCRARWPDGCGGFQHAAARRRLGAAVRGCWLGWQFQHAAARRRLGAAAAWTCVNNCSFNTQPPEGGWIVEANRCAAQNSFNTQPPEGGWDCLLIKTQNNNLFQHAAARRRLGQKRAGRLIPMQFQHAAARRRLDLQKHHLNNNHCFNTQPPEGGWLKPFLL